MFRNLIDETLQIQEANALEMEVTPPEVDEAYARFAGERNQSPAALDAYLLSVGSSPSSLKRQIEGEMAWNNLLRDYQKARLESFLNPQVDVQGSGYQLYQAQIAVGSGGWIGKGLTNGTQGQGDYLPVQTTDFVFAVLAEELGFIGATIIVACFCVIAWRGLRTSLRAPDRFGAFLALGLTTMVAFQAFFNVSVVLGILPTKGIPLPFVSYGGSSLLINLIGIGMLLNVCQHASAAHGGTTTFPTADA